MLLDRVERAKAKKERHPTERSSENHIEAAKDVFAFVHLMQLVEEMTGEIAELRSQAEESDGRDEDSLDLSDPIPDMFSSPKKHYWN